MLSDLSAYWQDAFASLPPIAYKLREGLPDRWVRFHTLPQSKRYPDTPEELAIILERHNTLLGELVNADQELILVSTGYSASESPIRTNADIKRLDPDAETWMSVRMHELELDETDRNYWHFCASRWRWAAGVFDPILRLVADDVIANVLIVCVESKWVYAPYDGGMDVFLDTSAKRDALSATHADWRSTHPAGY